MEARKRSGSNARLFLAAAVGLIVNDYSPERGIQFAQPRQKNGQKRTVLGLQGGQPTPNLCFLRSFLCDPRRSLSDVLAPGFLLQLRGALHLLAGAVCEGFGPFAFLAGFLTCGQFAFRHDLRMSYARSLGYPSRLQIKRSLTSLLSFRMISDTRIECQNAYSEGEGAGVWSTGSDRGGVEPRSSGSVGLDGFLSWLRQCGSHLPPLRHQPPDVLSLAATV